MRHVLNRNGIASWMAPADIPAGSKYAQVINKAIRDCACMMLLLSDASQNSVWVAREVERAVNYRKEIIPVQLEELVLNEEFEFYLCTDQIVALRGIDENQQTVQKLISSVRNYTEGSSIKEEHQMVQQSLIAKLGEGEVRETAIREKQFDVFISFKELDCEGELTQEQVLRENYIMH